MRTGKKKAALLLRFHTLNPADDAPVFTTYADIARALRITYTQARHYCCYVHGPTAYKKQ